MKKVARRRKHQHMKLLISFFNLSSTILFRLRKTVAFVKRSSSLQSFVYGEIKKQGLKINNLSSYFHVRLNSTFLMISKIITAKNLYNKITIYSSTINRSTEKWISKLKKLNLLLQIFQFEFQNLFN